jgi:hypothetical protein
MAEEIRHPVFELFESNETARSDMRTFLTLLDADQLVEALAAEEDLVAAPEAARSKVAALAAGLSISVDTVWSALRVIDWLCRNADNLDVNTLVADLIQFELVRAENAELSTQFFERVIDTFEPAFERRFTLSAIMRTFRGVEYACDLRVVGSDNTERKNDELSFVPVCIVRIHNDEGEPFVFQCAAPDLERLIEAFDNAKKLLSDSLRKIT